MNPGIPKETKTSMRYKRLSLQNYVLNICTILVHSVCLCLLITLNGCEPAAKRKDVTGRSDAVIAPVETNAAISPTEADAAVAQAQKEAAVDQAQADFDEFQEKIDAVMMVDEDL